MPPKKVYKKYNSSRTYNTNATYLIIVESPSKCKKIEEYLGDDYCCIASKGHIRTIDGLKSIDTKKSFEPTFTLIDEKKSHVEEMKSVIEKFSKNNIIIASDDDREGEAIAWHICQVFGLPLATTKRIIFHEITKPAIIAAVKTPGLVNMKVVHAQHARQVLDVIVGYKVSPYLWKYLYNSKTNSLSAGRCQTPALRLVYDNENQKNAGLETKYKTIGNFFPKKINFSLKREFDTNTEVIDFLEKSKTFEHYLKMDNPKESIKNPPRPFYTSLLLQTSSNILHYSPKETMDICQKLYQNGYITYMRTESPKYSKVFLDQVSKYIKNEWISEKYIGNTDLLEIKDASNPHEAIRVTNLETKVLPIDDKRMTSLYKLIWKNTVESCMAPALFKNVNTSICAPNNNEYNYIVEIPVFLGWKIVSDKKDEEQSSQTGLQLYLQSIMASKKPLEYNYIESTVVVRNKHSHYTEASLINKLEELGIGRPSTFASIVETIQDRGYVKKMDLEGTKTQCLEYKLINKNIEASKKEKVFGNEKGKLVIQPIGNLTVEFLLKNFDNLFSYEYTKNMESELDKLGSDENKEWSQICRECYEEIKTLSKSIKDISKQSYNINNDYEFIFEKYGPALRKKKEDGEYEYCPVKKDINIDLEKLKLGQYKLNDLQELKNNCLGKYEGEDIFIKSGQYGAYVEWGENRESIKAIKKPLSDVTVEDIDEYLSKKSETLDNNTLRKLTPDMCIKKGKFGAYVFYKTSTMNKPQFLNIKHFNEGYLTCQTETLVNWLCEKYNI